MTENSSNASWLKYLINEEVYILDEKGPNENSEEFVNPAAAGKKDGPMDDLIPEKPETKELLVLLPVNNSREIAENNYTLLWKVLGAVNLDENDVHILEVPEDERETAIQEFDLSKYSKSIIFDPTLCSKAEYPAELYKVDHGVRGKALRVDTLQVIAEDQDRKRALWAALKLMFEIK